MTKLSWLTPSISRCLKWFYFDAIKIISTKTLHLIIGQCTTSTILTGSPASCQMEYPAWKVGVAELQQQWCLE